MTRPRSLRRGVLALLGAALGVVVWAWARTLRVVFEDASGTFVGSGPRVFSFFHGQQMALVAAPRAGRTAVLVSHSQDGELQSAVMRALSFLVVRGSSSRGGAAGLRGLVRLVRSGCDAALSVDGPRGPAGRAKEGAIALSQLSGAPLVPVASAASRKVVLRRAWDRFEIPLPFSKVAVVLGAPVSNDPGATVALEDAIRAARARATELATSPGERAAWLRTASQ